MTLDSYRNVIEPDWDAIEVKAAVFAHIDSQEGQVLDKNGRNISLWQMH